MDLPHPEGPTTVRNSPAADLQVEVVERDELAQLLVVVVADPEGLPDVAQFDA